MLTDENGCAIGAVASRGQLKWVRVLLRHRIQKVTYLHRDQSESGIDTPHVAWHDLRVSATAHSLFNKHALFPPAGREVPRTPWPMCGPGRRLRWGAPAAPAPRRQVLPAACRSRQPLNQKVGL